MKTLRKKYIEYIEKKILEDSLVGYKVYQSRNKSHISHGTIFKYLPPYQCLCHWFITLLVSCSDGMISARIFTQQVICREISEAEIRK